MRIFVSSKKKKKQNFYGQLTNDSWLTSTRIVVAAIEGLFQRLKWINSRTIKRAISYSGTMSLQLARRRTAANDSRDNEYHFIKIPLIDILD